MDGGKINEEDEANDLGCELNIDINMYKKLGRRVAKGSPALKRLHWFCLHSDNPKSFKMSSSWIKVSMILIKTYKRGLARVSCAERLVQMSCAGIWSMSCAGVLRWCLAWCVFRVSCAELRGSLARAILLLSPSAWQSFYCSWDGRSPQNMAKTKRIISFWQPSARMLGTFGPQNIATKS